MLKRVRPIKTLCLIERASVLKIIRDQGWQYLPETQQTASQSGSRQWLTMTATEVVRLLCLPRGINWRRDVPIGSVCLIAAEDKWRCGSWDRLGWHFHPPSLSLDTSLSSWLSNCSRCSRYYAYGIAIHWRLSNTSAVLCGIQRTLCNCRFNSLCESHATKIASHIDFRVPRNVTLCRNRWRRRRFVVAKTLRYLTREGVYFSLLWLKWQGA